MKYFKNTSWLFAEKILRMIVGLFVGVWVARYLGPDRFGLLSYAQSFVGLFTAIAALGLDGIVVRELVKHPEKENELLGTAFYLKLMGAVSTFMILYIAIHVISNDHYTNIMIFIIASATIFQSFNVIDMYFQSKVMSKFVVYANIISLFISSLVKIALILLDAPLIAFAWIILFDSFVLACGFVYFFLKNSTFKIQHLKFSKLTAVNLLRDSWPLILSGMVIIIYMRIDQIMIKEMMNSEAVGQYAAAVRLNEAWYFIPVILGSSLFPAIINAKKTNSKFYYKRLQKFYDLMVWFGIGVTIPMFFLNDWIIDLLFGYKYHNAASVLLILFSSSLAVTIGMSNASWLLLENLQKINMINKFIGMLSNIGLNYLLIPMYGINGAAIATLISYFFTNYFILYFSKKTRESFFNISKSFNIFGVIKRMNYDR